MTVRDPWDLAVEGRFLEAIDAYSQRIMGSAQELDFHNRGTMFLQLERYAEAAADFRSVIDMSDVSSDGAPKKLGTALWLLGRDTEAIEAWMGGLGAVYTDAAGGVVLPAILLNAALSTHDAALEKRCRTLLRKRWKPGKSLAWPGPLAGLHLGHVEPSELDRSFSLQPVVRARQTCQADFHRAVYYRAQGDLERANEFRALAAGNDIALLETEKYLARRIMREDA